MNISNFKSTYGYIGFIPFALLSIAPCMLCSEVSTIAITFQLSSGFIILPFLGCMTWGWSQYHKNQKFNLSIGILYSLIGCLILLLTYNDAILIALLISVFSFQSFYYFEKSTESFKFRDDDYKKFRKMLSLLVSISFLISSAYWINPYSNPLI